MPEDACIIVLNPFTNDARVLKTAQTLRQSGWTVRVVALEGPGLPNEEVADGIRVLRPRLLTRRLPRNAVTRILSFIEFAARAMRHVKAADLVWCNDLGTLVMARGWRGMLRGRRRWVYDTHEMAINDLPGEGRGRIVVKYWLERLCIRAADRVICVSPEIARAYALLYRIPRPSIVLNCPRATPAPRSTRLRSALGVREDQRIYLYQGRLTRGRGIEALLSAFASRAGDDDVIAFMGYGPLEATIREHTERCPRIRFHAAVPPSELLEWTASADFGLCFTEDSCLTNRWCLPNKLFEYVMAGIPVIASNTPSVARLVRKEGVGVITNGSNSRALGLAIEQVRTADQAALRASAASARRRYCWESQEAVILEVAGPHAPGLPAQEPSSA